MGNEDLGAASQTLLTKVKLRFATQAIPTLSQCNHFSRTIVNLPTTLTLTSASSLPSVLLIAQWYTPSWCCLVTFFRNRIAVLCSFINTRSDPFFVHTTVGAGTPLAEQRSFTLEPLSTDWSVVMDWISGSTIKNETAIEKWPIKAKESLHKSCSIYYTHWKEWALLYRLTQKLSNCWSPWPTRISSATNSAQKAR